MTQEQKDALLWALEKLTALVNEQSVSGQEQEQEQEQAETEASTEGKTISL